MFGQFASNLHDFRVLKLQLGEHCKVFVVQDVLYCSIMLTASAQVLALRISDLRALQQRNLEKTKDYTFWHYFHGIICMGSQVCVKYDVKRLTFRFRRGRAFQLGHIKLLFAG